MANTIYVRPIKDNRTGFDSQVILFDHDDRHPNGSALVYRKDAVFEVGDTANVRRKIESGFLRRADGPTADPVSTPVVEDDDSTVTSIPDAEVLNEWSIADLRALATDVGVFNPESFKGNGAKDELIAAIVTQSDANEANAEGTD